MGSVGGYRRSRVWVSPGPDELGFGGSMARINIEDDLESHDEFFALVGLLLPRVGGDIHLARDVALGSLNRFFRLAQKWFQKPEDFPAVTGTIPPEELKAARLECMIESGWAVLSGVGGVNYQVKNANKHFQWLVTAKENGKKGGRPPKRAEPEPEPDGNPDEPEETGRLPDETGRVPNETGTNPPTLTHSLTPTLSHSLSQDLDLKKGDSDAQSAPARPASHAMVIPKPGKTPGTMVWESYAKAYEARYGAAPPRNERTNALCAQLVKRLGTEAAPEVAAFYVDHPKPYYAGRGHPLSALIADAETLHTEWTTGRLTQTGTRTREQAVSDANRELYLAIERGEV